MFVVARNPQDDSRLPYLLRLPLEGGVLLKARTTWPSTARVYCHRFEEPWPQDAEIIEQTPVRLCRRRGAAIDLVLDRPRLSRSQFVFTELKGREAIFWQTQNTARTANPGGRIPAGAPSPAPSRSPSTAASATRTASATTAPRPHASRSRPATTPSTRRTAACSRPSSARAFKI
jgi:hypothetical protein